MEGFIALNYMETPEFSFFCIPVYRCQSKFRKELYERIDNSVLTHLYLQSANRWLGVRLVSFYPRVGVHQGQEEGDEERKDG